MKPTKAAKALAEEFAGDDETQSLMRLIVNQAAKARGLTPPWDLRLADDRIESATRLIAELGDPAGWGASQFGEIYEHVISEKKRERLGAWYTPPVAADAMVAFSIGPQLDRVAEHPDPGNVLQVLALDPSCGAGVFLISAARFISRRYASLIGRTDEPTDWMIRTVMPEVMSECIFGIDIDPIAVDMAKSACWLEMGGTQPIGFMDRNIICGNALNNDSPPKLEERLVEQGDLFADEDVA